MQKKLVHGSGRCPADIMVVGSEPGWKEMQSGEVFVGPTGDELDRLLAGAGIRRTDCFLTNLFREMPPVKGKPHPPEHFAEGAHALKEELRRVQPTLIITLGREATRYFLGDVDMDDVWGLHLTIPDKTRERLDMLRDDCTIAPQVHPAAGFHSPEESAQTLVGFEELRRVLDGTLPARGLYEDTYPDPRYALLDSEGFNAWTDDYAAVLDIAVDTEGYTHAPWSIQASKVPGEAMMLRTPEMWREFAEWSRAARPVITGHSLLHDATMLRVMCGLDIFEEEFDYDDTQHMAYLLNVLPQGLKALCTRLHGMRMQSYKEVLGDAANRNARTYLYWLWELLNDEWQQERQREFDFQVAMGRRIKVLPKLPKTKLYKAVERVMRSDEPARLWGDQVIDLQVEAHKLMGPLPEASLTDVSFDTALHYANRDADGTCRVKQALMPRLQQMGLEEVYRLDLGTYPIIDRMMRVGITPDHAAFGKLAGVLDAELDELRTQLAATTGIDTFNPNSGDQTADYLYEHLGLEPLGKMTDSGRGSTNDIVLEALEKAHPEFPQIADIRSYREYYKLRWTFVERLPELVNRWPHDERIHCELMLTRTPSGRLAAKNPNLLAMPKHGKFAKAFRRCFVPGIMPCGEPRLFLSSDESQVELRVLAHLSQDPVMRAVFCGEKRNPDGSKIDLHAAMAQRIFGVAPAQQDESKHRLPAKAVNFGLPMGMTAVGLTLQLRKGGLDVDEDDAQRWIDDADTLYAAVPGFKAACVREAELNGHVRCLSGRIRYVGGIRSRDRRVRAEAERFAFSTKIQEGAQWIGKQVLASAWKDIFCPLRRAGQWIEPLLWIHDDLLSEMEPDLVMDVAPRLKACMTQAPAGFSVPLETKPEAGYNWADMVKV